MQFGSVADSIRSHTRLDTFLEHFTVTARVPRERREPIARPWLIDAVRAVAAKLKSALAGGLLKTIFRYSAKPPTGVRPSTGAMTRPRGCLQATAGRRFADKCRSSHLKHDPAQPRPEQALSRRHRGLPSITTVRQAACAGARSRSWSRTKRVPARHSRARERTCAGTNDFLSVACQNRRLLRSPSTPEPQGKPTQRAA
jgi:hypothetical protein